jgi:hemerythrin superfamily protein
VRAVSRTPSPDQDVRVVFSAKECFMPTAIAYEDAVDLLDSDHKLVQKLFIQFQTLHEFGALPADRRTMAERICAELTIHTQIEEELFYPAVREATGDDALLDHAEEEHQEAKDLIARIQAMGPEDEGYDDCVQQLAGAVMAHVMEERERVFLQARYSPLDLRGLAVELYERKQELKSAAGGMPELPPEKTPEQIEEQS